MRFTGVALKDRYQGERGRRRRWSGAPLGRAVFFGIVPGVRQSSPLAEFCRRFATTGPVTFSR